MAAISKPVLALTFHPQKVTNNVEATVEYTITFSKGLEVGHRYREVCRIFGEDDDSSDYEFDQGVDHYLGTPLLDTIYVAPATGVSRTGIHALKKTFTRQQLNEDSDSGEFDELKVLVTLTPTQPEDQNILPPTKRVGEQLEVGV